MALITQDVLGQSWAITVNADGSMTTTLVAAAPTSTTDSPILGGMLKSQIIDQANRRTQNKAVGALNLGREYAIALSDVCEAYHFFWRKKTAAFSTVAGAQNYDLAATVNGALTDMSEVSAVYLVINGNPLKLEPITESTEQIEALESDQTGQPEKYSPSLDGNPQGISLFPTPNSVYRVRVVHWAIPLVDEEDPGNVVPMVPPQMHKLVAKKLELNILEFTETEGTSSPRYVSCAREYDRMLNKAIDLGRNMSTEAVHRIKYPQTAIRSTR